MAPAPPDALLVAAGGTVWRLGGDGVLEHLASLDVSIEALLATTENGFAALQWEGAVWVHDGGSPRRLTENPLSR
jgi:hypothetical protein